MCELLGTLVDLDANNLEKESKATVHRVEYYLRRILNPYDKRGELISNL